MKRTFTVTIEDDKAYTDEDVRKALDLYADQTSVTVTETTAVHAKQMEVIDRAKAWLTAIVALDSNKSQSDDFGYAMDLERRQAELEAAVRALMEGKA